LHRIRKITRVTITDSPQLPSQSLIPEKSQSLITSVIAITRLVNPADASRGQTSPAPSSVAPLRQSRRPVLEPVQVRQVLEAQLAVGETPRGMALPEAQRVSKA
jgi:hypothetical protein